MKVHTVLLLAQEALENASQPISTSRWQKAGVEEAQKDPTNSEEQRIFCHRDYGNGFLREDTRGKILIWPHSKHMQFDSSQ